MAEDKYVQKLRRKLEKTLSKGRADKAIELLEELVELDQSTPRWRHKQGDLLRKQGQVPEAIAAYAAAVDLYASQGFLARAVAMAKTILDLDPTRIDVLERVDPQAAQTIRRQRRPAKPMAQAQNPAVIPDAPVPRHPMVLDEFVAPTAADPANTAGASPPADAAPAAPPTPRGGPPPPPPVPRSNAGPPAAAPPAPKATQPRNRPITLDKLSLPPRSGQEPRGIGERDLADIYSQALNNAPDLTVDPGAAPNETRFSMAPPRHADSIPLELSNLEFEERSLPPSDPESSPAPEPTADALSTLPLFPLFADVGKEALSELVRGSTLVEGEDGELLMRTGDPADALFGIMEGTVRVVVPGQKIRLTLGEGDVFGEACLLSEEPRQADAVAHGHVAALRIPRSVLHELIRRHPRVAEILLGLLTRRLLGNLLQTSPLFSDFSGAQRADLARLFEVRRAAAGTRLAVAGKRMDALYISLTGQLAMAKPGAAPTIVGPGHMCGQAAIVSEAASRVDITSQVNMIVLRLPLDAVAKVAANNPEMLTELSVLAAADIVKITT